MSGVIRGSMKIVEGVYPWSKVIDSIPTLFLTNCVTLEKLLTSLILKGKKNLYFQSDFQDQISPNTL